MQQNNTGGGSQSAGGSNSTNNNNNPNSNSRNTNASATASNNNNNNNNSSSGSSNNNNTSGNPPASRSAATRGGRNLHIAHRRSPSELTPLMVEQLALQQQIEMLQAQQQQILAQHQQFAQAGLLPGGMPQGQGLMPPPNMQGGGYVPYQFQQQQQPPPAAAPPQLQPQHQSQQPQQPQQYQGPQKANSYGHGGHRRAQSSVGPGFGGERFGHNRRHSLALSEAKKAAAIEQAKRQGGQDGVENSPPPSSSSSSSATAQKPAQPAQQAQKVPQFKFPSSPDKAGANNNFRGHGRSQSMQVGSRFRNPSPQRSFQFPPKASDDTNSGTNQNNSTPGKAHQRSGSRNFDTNWRESAPAPNFVPGHRQRGSFSNSVSNFNNFYQGNNNTNNNNNNNQNGQGRKSLFAPYLPQASLPGLLNEGRLVAGILRVNRKNRSDAYVSTNGLLDADIFICGSKDRNRALEGDLVAVELLEVDEVWGSKKEKEEKKKRKDQAQDDEQSQPQQQSQQQLSPAPSQNNSGNNNGGGGLRRKGSLRQRPTQKKNDDVEVEGQSLLLVEEEELSDAAKPLYAGHVVAVIERFPGQMFSGSLGLLRPSSQATKDKQDAERKERGEEAERLIDRPKIVWFKPTDKRVPLIAIPTEQAPKDFVENHNKYSDKIFIASIKRWPITSLHPFGTLVEELGPANDLNIEVEAILRDNNFTADSFAENVIASASNIAWEKDGRVDYTAEEVVAFGELAGEGIHVKQVGDKLELGVHVVDIGEFVKPNSPLEREAKKRGTSVFLKQKTINMFPQELNNQASFQVGKETPTISIVFTIDGETFETLGCQMKLGFVKPTRQVGLQDKIEDLDLINKVAKQLRELRYNSDSGDVPILGLLNQVDDENVVVTDNTYDGFAVQQMVDEINIKINTAVAQKLSSAFGERAFLRRHAEPIPQRMETFKNTVAAASLDIDTESSESLQKSLFDIKDDEVRKSVETLLNKCLLRAKYHVPGKATTDEQEHYYHNSPIYTHFTCPLRRYADVVVHRQLKSLLSNVEYTEDIDAIASAADLCNFKKDAAKNAQEQSVHLYLSKQIASMTVKTGQLIQDAIVIQVYESAFDVFIPEFGIEKRVHGDQLPLVKAEFNKSSRLLELFWQAGVDSAFFTPADENKRPQRKRASSAASAAAQEMTQKFANMNVNYDTKPGDNKALDSYLKSVVTRTEGNNKIQEIRVLQHIPVILRAEVGKSIPCLTVRTLNPFA